MDFFGKHYDYPKDCKNCGFPTFFDFCGWKCAREYKTPPVNDMVLLGDMIEAAGQEGCCYP